MKNLITIHPEIHSGEPVFTGTRVPIKIMFDYLKAGDTIDKFVQQFPTVTKEHALAVLELMEKTFAFKGNEKVLLDEKNIQYEYQRRN